MLGGAFILICYGYLNGNLMLVLGQQNRLLKISLVALVFNLIGNGITIPLFGFMGAAWMTLATEAVVLVQTTRLLIRELGTEEFGFGRVARTAIAAVLLGLVLGGERLADAPLGVAHRDGVRALPGAAVRAEGGRSRRSPGAAPRARAGLATQARAGRRAPPSCRPASRTAPRVVALLAALARRAGELRAAGRVREQRGQRLAQRAGIAERHDRAGAPSSSSSGIAPTAVETAGVPHAIASSSTHGLVSPYVGRTSRSACW